VRGQRGHVRPTTIVVVVAVAQHGLWGHTTSTSTPMSGSKDQMRNQLHGVVLMVLLFDVLVFYGSF
jgi:hypothetical protein